MIDTDKYAEDVDEVYNLIMNDMDDDEREFEIKTRIRERNRILVAADKLDAEVKRLQYSYDMAVKQLQNTRLWIAKYEGVLKEMANQASVVKCSALNIDEWIEGVKL